MANKHTGRAEKGSRFHLQNLIKDEQTKLNTAIMYTRPSLKSWLLSPPTWVSPLSQDNYKEYQDREFLEKINCIEVYPQLKKFWPNRGLVWDGLATLSGIHGEKGVILLESKSHLEEVINPSYAIKASPKSREKINTSLNIVKSALGVDESVNWLGDVYQHSNRIAHLYFLRFIAKIPTWLVFLYFLRDRELDGPEHTYEYSDTLGIVKVKLGLPDRHILGEYMSDIFIEVPYLR